MSEPKPLKHLLLQLLCHGQYLLVYPAAFEKQRPLVIKTPAMYGIPYMAPFIRTPDGVNLSCYLLPQTEKSLTMTYLKKSARRRQQGIEDIRIDLTPAALKAQATVIVFHGNAAHHWEDMESAKDFFEMRCNVLLVSYRGYSLSSGSPTEKGLRIDAQAALDYVLSQPFLSRVPIILYGHSLGGAVAIDLASRNPSTASALIVSNTFTSIPDIVREWPIIGILSFLCHQKWNSAARIHRIPTTTPILMLSGRRDEVVHPKLMDRLWELALKRGEKRKSRWSWRKQSVGSPPVILPAKDVFQAFERGTHCTTADLRGYWEAVVAFVLSIEGPPFGDDPIPVLSVDRATVDTRWRYIAGEVIVEVGGHDTSKEKGGSI